MDRWAAQAKEESSGSATLDVNDGKETGWEEFGFHYIPRGKGFSVPGFLRIGSSTDCKTFQLSDQQTSNVEIKMTWRELKFFNDRAGIWDVREICKTYKRTGKLNQEETDLIHPVQFLCASGLSLECTLHEETKDEFERLRGEQVQARGEASVRYGLFGFEAGGSCDKANGVQTSTAEWDAAAGKLTFSPTPTFGCCTLLGVRAQGAAY